MKLEMNQPIFEYDIRGLLMAFYPGEEIVTGDEPADKVFYAEFGGTSESCLLHQEDILPCRLCLENGEKCIERKLFLNMKERPAAKTALKQALYSLLSEDTEKRLPWGTLTGIRPTKIAMSKLNAGESEEEILSHLRNDLYVSEEKAALSLDIAKRENRLLNMVAVDGGYSLYVNIPFCPTTCAYCSFTSYPLEKFRNRVPHYLEALKKELAFAAELFQGRPLQTIYFGGGTPTTLEAEEMDGLLTSVENLFDISGVKEWTVEAGRPDSITEDKLKVLRNHPVSRISINPQTMHQKTLDIIGRRHKVEDIYDIFAMARRLGFDNINMDLILGLPGETAEDVEETMKAVTSMDPDNVTLHSLAIKRAARLNTEKDMYMGYRMVNTEGIMDMCARYLTEAGQHPYYLYRQKNMAGNLENVGYAKEGKEGIYNILIMEEVQTILACGTGSVTKRVFGDGRIERCDNVKNVDLYISGLEEMMDRKRKLFSDDY